MPRLWILNYLHIINKQKRSLNPLALTITAAAAPACKQSPGHHSSWEFVYIFSPDCCIVEVISIAWTLLHRPHWLHHLLPWAHLLCGDLHRSSRYGEQLVISKHLLTAHLWVLWTWKWSTLSTSGFIAVKGDIGGLIDPWCLLQENQSLAISHIITLV